MKKQFFTGPIDDSDGAERAAEVFMTLLREVLRESHPNWTDDEINWEIVSRIVNRKE